MGRVDRSGWLTCDRCEEPVKVLREHEDAMANDGKGTPMRPARHCGRCIREMSKPRRRRIAPVTDPELDAPDGAIVDGMQA